MFPLQTPKFLKDLRYMQYVASITATFSVAASGMHLGWSSPSVPLLTGEKEGLDFTLTSEETSWVVSGYSLGLMVGCVFIKLLVNGVGRKGALLVGALPQFLCWILLVFCKQFPLLLLARIFGGIGTAIALQVSSMYIGEIADKDVRGKLGSVLSILKVTGTLLVLIVGPFVSYYTLAWFCAIFPIIFLISFFKMPESPYYFILKGDMGRAEQSLIRLSPANTPESQINYKLTETQNHFLEDSQNKSSIKELFMNKLYRKSLIIVFGLKSLQQLSGMIAIQSYMETIINNSQSSIPGDISSVLFGLVQLFGAICSIFFVDRFGRKALLISSGIACATALIAEGIYFYFSDVIEANVDAVSWLPTTGIVMYLFCSCFGIYTLPYLMMGEFFATNIKAIGISLIFFCGAALGFGTAKLFSPVSEAFGMYTVFWIFALFCILGIVFVITMVPETKNKSLEEIQEELSGNKKGVSKKALENGLSSKR